MYSTLTVKNHSNRSGRIIGTHQKLDRIARRQLGKFLPLRTNLLFPDIDSILHFEGMQGPDGLKRKSPGVDEPNHFIMPNDDDGQLFQIISDHQYNLHYALKKKNAVRAAFEAAWLAHAVTDGLTPAHHFPLSDARDELMSEKDFIQVFGAPIKGIMHGKNWRETMRNNWLYWGANGYMSKHVAFEYGVAITMTALPNRSVVPKLSRDDLKHADLHDVFYRALEIIAGLEMYDRFRRDGWTTSLALDTKRILLPEIIRAIILCWASSIPNVSDNNPYNQLLSNGSNTKRDKPKSKRKEK